MLNATLPCVMCLPLSFRYLCGASRPVELRMMTNPEKPQSESSELARKEVGGTGAARRFDAG